MTAVADAARTIRCNQTLDGRPCQAVVSGDTPAERLAKMGAHVAAAHGAAPHDAMADALKIERAVNTLGKEDEGGVRDAGVPGQEQKELGARPGGGAGRQALSAARPASRESAAATVTTKAAKARARPGKERCAECGRKASSVPMSPSQHRKDCSRHAGAKSKTSAPGYGVKRAGASRKEGARGVSIPALVRVSGEPGKRGYYARHDDGTLVAPRVVDVAAEIKRLKGVIAGAQAQLDAIRAALDEDEKTARIMSALTPAPARVKR